MAKEDKDFKKDNRSPADTETTSLEDRNKNPEEADCRNFYYKRFLPLGVFECDSEGSIIRANETFYNLLGLIPDKNTHVNLKGFFGSDKRFETYLNSLEPGGVETFSQMEMVLADNTVIYSRISTYVEENKDKQLVLNCTLEDCTHEVILEKKLNQSHRIETLGTLAGGIAHDFNTILTTITGYTELAMDELDHNSSAYNYISRILNSVNRAEAIVNQMLTFSKQMDIEQVPIQLEFLLTEVCEFMQSALPFNILLNSSFEKIDGFINADPTQLFRVFLNIMTNSMQAMEDKGGSIEVITKEISKNRNRFAEIAITDTGSGIDKAILDRIYEPFFTTKSTGKGTGMGLAVVYGIISGIGGDIDVESEAGHGTTFKISIPIMSKSEAELVRKADIARDTDHRIVYIDNNINFSRTVSLALERLGYNVDLVSDIATMDTILKKNEKINTVFLRCSFEEKDKEKILQRILETESISRIIMITVPGISIYRKVLEVGRDRISLLSEPVTLRDILSSI